MTNPTFQDGALYLDQHADVWRADVTDDVVLIHVKRRDDSVWEADTPSGEPAERVVAEVGPMEFLAAPMSPASEYLFLFALLSQNSTDPAVVQRVLEMVEAVRAEATESEGKSSLAADTTPRFFEPGHLYTDNTGYRAPEMTYVFHCGAVTTTPTGERIAFGFARRADREAWTPTGFGDREWGTFVKVRKGDDR